MVVWREVVRTPAARRSIVNMLSMKRAGLEEVALDREVMQTLRYKGKANAGRCNA